MRRIFPRIMAALVLVSAASVAAAQTSTDARQALSRFPESQGVLYLNASRIINVAMPRVMPPGEYQKMLDEARKVGVDARGIDYAIVGVRFAPSAPAGAPPEVLAVVRGSFNANALLTLARTFAGGQAKMREESYGAKSLLIMDLRGEPKPEAGGEAGGGDSGPRSPTPFPEVAAAALDANTLVVGVPAYVKAAVDADAGSGGLKAAMIDLAARDQHSLMSLTADLPENLPDYAQKLGISLNEEARRMIGWLKSVSFSTGMDDVNFTSRVAVMTSAPEQASTLDGMLQFGLTAAEAALRSEAAKSKDPAQARTALAALRGLTHGVEGSTLEVGVALPQATVTEMIRKEMRRKQAAAQGATKARPRPRAARRGANRRR
jgi:hypothetical protein